MKESNYKKQLQEHKNNYIHIPFSWNKAGYFFLFLLCLLITIGYFQVLLYEWNTHNVSLVFNKNCGVSNNYCKEIITLSQLAIIPHLIFQYILTAISILSFFKIFKKKLKELNKKGLVDELVFGLVDEHVFGLVDGLVFGLVVGLVVGLVFGLVFGLIFGLVDGLVFGLVDGLVFGLVIGLVIGLVVGLVIGLSNECNGDD